eukprot:4033940-Prymnesium_polylepis.2
MRRSSGFCSSVNATVPAAARRRKPQPTAKSTPADARLSVGLSKMTAQPADADAKPASFV